MGSSAVDVLEGRSAVVGVGAGTGAGPVPPPAGTPPAGEPTAPGGGTGTNCCELLETADSNVELDAPDEFEETVCRGAIGDISGTDGEPYSDVGAKPGLRAAAVRGVGGTSAGLTEAGVAGV